MRGEERGRGRGLPRRRKQVPVCMEESLPERPRGRGMAGGGSVSHGPSVFTDLEVRLRGAGWSPVPWESGAALGTQGSHMRGVGSPACWPGVQSGVLDC